MKERCAVLQMYSVPVDDPYDCEADIKKESVCKHLNSAAKTGPKMTSTYDAVSTLYQGTLVTIMQEVFTD